MQFSSPQNESARLESLRSFGVLYTSCEQAFDDIAHLAALICDAPVGIVAFIDEQKVWFKAKVGLEVNEIPRNGSFCDHAIMQGGLLIVSEPLSDDRFMRSFLVEKMGITFYAGAPLITDDGHPLGSLAVMDRVPHFFTSEQSDSLCILARWMMHELEQRRARRVQVPRKVRRPLRSITILLVEENINLRNLLHRSLEADGYSVLPASDGDAAINFCRHQGGAIDLVLTDTVNPRVNGIELSQQIRAVRPETRFLFITGLGDELPESHELVEYGANILEKPFLPSELLQRVEAVLGQGKEAML